jgi:hypothetical protein
MHDEQIEGGEQSRVPKEFRRRAHTFGAEGATRPKPSNLKLSTPHVKGQNLGEGPRNLPRVGVPPRPLRPTCGHHCESK